MAVCRLVDCQRTPARLLASPWRGRLTDRELALGVVAEGRLGWVLADVRALPAPVPCRGALGQWAVPLDVAARLEARP